MKIRTIKPVPNADAFEKQDCKIIARLPNFNLVTGIHQVIYELEIPYIPTEGAEVQYRIKHYRDSEVLIVNAQEVNSLMASLETDLNVGYNYWQNIQAAVHEVFRYKVGLDGRFGLGPDDWEKI